MKINKSSLFFLCVLCASAVNLLSSRAADAPTLYANDFEKATEGEVPSDMVVLSGTFTVKKVDPMKFENVLLAKGPAGIYPRTTVSGRLDFDYETGNWLTDGIRFHYNLDGKDYEDVITGTIKWVEDPSRATNGRGHYEFNLRFNEEKNRPAKGEGAAFENANPEEAFFAVDEDLPSLTGKIDYVDTFIPGGTTPSSSKVTYHLKANKLSKQQVMNFFKLWLLCASPTNDE